MIDEMAERIRALDATAMGTLQEYLLASRLEEGRPPAGSAEMIAGLLQKHEAIVRNLRGDLQQAEELGNMGNQRLPDWADGAARKSGLDAAGIIRPVGGTNQFWQR